MCSSEKIVTGFTMNIKGKKSEFDNFKQVTIRFIMNVTIQKIGLRLFVIIGFVWRNVFDHLIVSYTTDNISISI